MQFLQNTAGPLLIDELEGDHRRRQLMEILRSSATGGVIARGTKNQHGKSYGLKHIAILSSIELDLSEAADASRFLSVCLEAKSETERDRLFLPTGQEFHELRRLLLTSSTSTINDALSVIDKIRAKGLDGRRSRLLDCLTPLAAMLACLNHSDELKQVEATTEFLREVCDVLSPKDMVSRSA